MASDPRELIDAEKGLPDSTARSAATAGYIMELNSAKDGYDLVANTSTDIVGEIKLWPTETPPTGYLACDGRAVSRTVTYGALFAVLSTMYGVGDGSTTFNLPNLGGKFVRGWDTLAQGVDAAGALITRTDRGDGTIGDHVGTNQPASTARSTINMTTNDPGTHTHALHTRAGIGLHSGGYVRTNNLIGADYGGATSGDGEHTHTVSAGGDAETVPININLMYIIKY